MLKRYLVFAGDNYSPSPAMGDFKEDADFLEDANHIAHCLRNENVGPGDWASARYDWVQIYDTETRMNIWMNTKP